MRPRSPGPPGPGAAPAADTLERMAPRHPLVIGHRGAPGYRPEHSRSSYDLALAMGVDAVEPDIVVSRDGVLVVRHENEISGTTDVATRPEFADRRTTKVVDGQALSGWFTEDFEWDELRTLRCRERLPKIRRTSASFDDRQPVLRLRDVLDLVRAACAEQSRPIGVVLEIKHATYFAGIGLDPVPLLAAELAESGWTVPLGPVVVEAFESTALTRLRALGIPGTYVYLIEASGRPFDLVGARGSSAPTYRESVEPAGLDALVGVVDGVSVDRRMILETVRTGRGFSVAEAHARGLQVYTWTCRPENTFLTTGFTGRGGAAAFGDYEGEWTLVRDAGVDGVFVDHADLGVDFFRREARGARGAGARA
jgi:glycerophosphoryl diester phosphodiesterase